MTDPELRRWADHLAKLGEDAASPPAGASAPFLAWRSRRPAPGPRPETPDDALWWSLANRAQGAGLTPDSTAPVDTEADGPLFPQTPGQSIEVWTERDLSGLHALWWIGRAAASPAISSRSERAARWHLEHTQPDNATNRPWALHVFLLLGDVDARLYAETLLHNCQVTAGRPDPLSAMILADSAEAIAAAIKA